MTEVLVNNRVIEVFNVSNREGGLVGCRLQFADDIMLFLDANK